MGGAKMAQNMPIGVSDFKKLICENFYFVDKTRFIQELIDQRREVTLITRPRRFGKTLNLSMLQYFFSLDNAEEHRKLFKGLAIERAGEKYMQEQGTRPVIMLTFKDVKANNWHSQQEILIGTLAKLYRKYIYLLQSDMLNEFDKEYFVSICKKTASLTDLRESIANLCEMLKKHLGKEAILLLDEYDTPIISSWEYGYYADCIDFFRHLYSSALKGNEYLDFAVVTGITRVSKESIFSGLNNIRVCSVLSDLYSDIFGFTADEAEKLMQDSGVAAKMSELKQWYDGYMFGKQEIYNPWSVINFVDHGCKFQPYWINMSGNAILKDLLQKVDSERQKELAKLLEGSSVKAPIIENIVYSDLHTNRDALYTMLLYTGYLKAIQQDEEFEDISIAVLQIPNREIRRAYKQEILQYVGGNNGIMPLYDMVSAITEGNVTKFTNYLSQVIMSYVSFHDTAQPESFYHGFLLGILVLFNKTHRIESNRESGYGRFDIALFPNTPTQAGAILEIKAAKSESELSQLAKDALAQIEAKAYTTDMQKLGVKEIWRYGIALCGKKIAVESI